MSDIDYVRIDNLPDSVKRLQKEAFSFHAYRKDDLVLFVAEESTPQFFGHDRGLHISISHPDRYPTWEEIKEARYRFMPRDKDAYMILPRQSDYVNVHPNCFHVWMPL